MKARLPINNLLKKRVKDEVALEYEKQRNDATRRIFKLMCVVLNEMDGYGKVRLSQRIAEVEKLCQEGAKDEVFWYHVDKVVIDQIGMGFDRENYNVMDR